MKTEEMKDMLAKVENLARMEVADKELMAKRLHAVLDYVGQLKALDIPSPELEDAHRMTIEDSQQEIQPFERDEQIIDKNYPQRDENGVVVPKFVKKAIS